MAGSRPNPRLAKIHRSYTVEEVARLYGVHRNTVRAWIKHGLPIIDNKRPVLIQGAQLVAFLQARRAQNKRPCQPGEIYCVRCREPRRPAGGAVRFRLLGPTTGNLVGVCSSCNSGLYRRVNSAKLALVLGDLTLVGTEAQDHIDESLSPSANCDFIQDDPNHGKAQR